MQLAPPEPSHCPDAMPPPDLPKVSVTTKSGRADAPETDGGLEGLECSGFRHSLLPEYLGSTPSAPLPPPPSWPEPVESGAMGQEDQGWSSFHALHAEELQGKLAMLARRMNLEAYPHKQNRFGADFALPPGTHLGENGSGLVVNDDLGNDGGMVVNHPMPGDTNPGIIVNHGGRVTNYGAHVANIGGQCTNVRGRTDNYFGTVHNTEGIVINNGGGVHNLRGYVDNRGGKVVNDKGAVSSFGGLVDNYEGEVAAVRSEIKNRAGMVRGYACEITNEMGIVENELGRCINIKGMVYNSDGFVDNFEGIVRNQVFQAQTQPLRVPWLQTTAPSQQAGQQQHSNFAFQQRQQQQDRSLSASMPEDIGVDPALNVQGGSDAKQEPEILVTPPAKKAPLCTSHRETNRSLTSLGPDMHALPEASFDQSQFQQKELEGKMDDWTQDGPSVHLRARSPHAAPPRPPPRRGLFRVSKPVDDALQRVSTECEQSGEAAKVTDFLGWWHEGRGEARVFAANVADGLTQIASDLRQIGADFAITPQQDMPHAMKVQMADSRIASTPDGQPEATLDDKDVDRTWALSTRAVGGAGGRVTSNETIQSLDNWGREIHNSNFHSHRPARGYLNDSSSSSDLPTPPGRMV